MMARTGNHDTRAKPSHQLHVPLIICLLGSCVSITALAVSEDAPAFLEQPHSQYVTPGEPAIFRCVAAPDHSAIEWLLDGQLIDQRRHRDLQVLGSELRVLQPDGSAGTVEGEFRCRATTWAGTVISQPAVLLQPALSRFTPVDDVTLVVPEGGYVTLTCEPPRSLPPAAVVFQRSTGQLLDTSTENIVRLPSGHLVVSNLTSTWAGDFRCVAINPVSRDNRTSPGAITVLVDRSQPAGSSPTATIMSGMVQKIQVEIGSNVTLECPSYGQSGAKLVWSKYGGSLPTGRFLLSAFGNLRLWDVTYEDSGTYRCGSQDKNERQVWLEVLTPPVVQMVRQPARVVQVGSRVDMACSVTGIPKPELQWFHNGHLLATNSEGLLILPAVRVSDAGLYQCMATNKLGTAHEVAHLKVAEAIREITSEQTDKFPLLGDDEDAGAFSGGGQPVEEDKAKHPSRDRKNSRQKGNRLKDRRKKKKNGPPAFAGKEKPKYAPSVPTVTQLSDRSVMLNWSVPDKGNGQTIKFFKVQYKEMNPEKGPWRTSDAHLSEIVRRFEVADLKSGGSYKFRILAVYEDDDNKNSANTAIFKLSVQPHAQVRAPDTAPTIVEAKPVFYQQNYGIGVKWQYKAESASPIEGFVIFYKPYGSTVDDKEKLIPGAGIRNDVIRDLLPNTPYNIRMQSFNTVGRSQFSNQVVKTTKLRGMEPDYPEQEFLPKEPEMSTETQIAGRRSSDTLENPVILGVVLGALLLALLILITMCWWKQRQQKRRGLVGSTQQKLQDQSQCLFADNSHPKLNGALYPANGGTTIPNGHGPYPEGHKHLNIEINPLAEYDMQTAVSGDSRAPLFYSVNNSISSPTHRFPGETGCHDNKTQHSGSKKQHSCNGDLPYMGQQKSLYSMQHCSGPHSSVPFYSEAGSLGPALNHEYSEPGDRELQCPGYPHPPFKTNLDQPGVSMGQARHYDYSWSGGCTTYHQPQVGVSHYSSLERLSPMYSSTSIDFATSKGVCQQHNNTHVLSSLPMSPSAHVHMSSFGTMPGCMGPVNPSLQGSGKHRRRRKRPHSREPGSREHAMKDQATNTDLSSNEGTLEYSSYCKSGSCSNSGSDMVGHHSHGSLDSVSQNSSVASSSSQELDLHNQPRLDQLSAATRTYTTS